jgi:hypothetical protein
MADIFAPKTSFNIGYERPVAQPVEDKRGETQAKFQAQANRIQSQAIRAQTQIESAKMSAENANIRAYGGLALSGLKFGMGYASQYQKGRVSGAAGQWLDSMSDAATMRDQGKFTEAALFERTATRAAVSAGVDLDKYKTEYEAITGRFMEYVGQTREQQVFEMMKNDKNFQMALLAAEATLPSGSTEDEILKKAQTSVTDQAIANNTLALVAAGNQLDWETRLKSVYNTKLDQFDQGVVASFISKQKQGQPISPDEVRGAIQKHTLMSSVLVKPPYVQEEQWNSIKQRMDRQREFLTLFLEGLSPESQIQSKVSKMLQSTDNIDDFMAVATASDPTYYNTISDANIPEVMDRVSKSAFSDNNFKNRGNILTDLQEIDVTEPVSGNSTFTIDTAPSFLKDHVNDDPKTMQKNVEAGLEMIKNIKPMELQGEGAIKQFYNATMSMAAGMLSDKEFYSSAKISKIFNNPNLQQSIEMISAVDREAADEIRIALRSVANLQRKALETNLSSMEGALVGGVWDEQDQIYYITGDQGKFLNQPRSVIKGEMTDKGFRISDTSTVFPEGYKEAIDRRKSIKILDRALNDLAIGDVDTTQPSVEEIATTALDQVDAEELRESSVRSIRNNNPGNIKKTNTQWEGMTQEQADSTFVSFESPEMGVRALARVLNTYNTQYNLDDISGMVSRFAPPTENDTQNYIKFVSEKSGIPRNRKITLQDNPEDMKKVIAAMIEMEGGSDSVKYFTPSIINEGVRLALESTASQDVGIDEDPQQATIERIPVRPDDETLGAAWDILYGNSMKPENKPLRESKRPQQRP